MTALAQFLEDFGSANAPSAQNALSEDMLEAERLEAFDKGYRAGWDDAIKAKSEDGEQLSNTLSQNLQDLSFTYHEAHAQVLSNLAPLFDEILQKLLPCMARETLGAHIAEQLSQTARQMGAVSVEVLVAPGAEPEVSRLIEATAGSLPITVRESELLGEGQAELKLGGKEIAIDLADVTTQITAAVEAALYQETVEYAHG